ncbi:hypothetical protein Z043_124683, partial [Scleropages formosus]
ACQLTLDTNTVNKHLHLSERNTVVTCEGLQSYPDHPERFDIYYQVLCTEGLSGRWYWELQWSGSGVYIAVSYKGISRKGRGNDCGLGLNIKSWSLFCSPSSYCLYHNNTFTSRAVLGRNTMLDEVVEKLKKTGLQAAPPAHCFAGPGDVVCHFCTGRRNKAVKSCLVCLASYCEVHLQPHYDSVPLTRHKLADSTRNLREKVCSRHDKLLEVYRRTDQQCIFLLCVMDEHRGHKTVSAAAEKTEKQVITLRSQVFRL